MQESYCGSEASPHFYLASLQVGAERQVRKAMVLK